jgi:hypothetical protein
MVGKLGPFVATGLQEVDSNSRNSRLSTVAYNHKIYGRRGLLAGRQLLIYKFNFHINVDAAAILNLGYLLLL